MCEPMETSSEITIQFVLRKGDGNWPSVEELSKEETEDLTRIGRFFLDFDDQNNSLLGTPITEVEIIYDGISFLNESQTGATPPTTPPFTHATNNQQLHPPHQPIRL